MLFYLNYLAPFLIAFLAAVILTPLARRFAVKKNIIDAPNEPRKIHQKAVPLIGRLGGVRRFCFNFIILRFLYRPRVGRVYAWEIYLGIILAGLVLMLGRLS